MINAFLFNKYIINYYYIIIKYLLLEIDLIFHTHTQSTSSTRNELENSKFFLLEMTILFQNDSVVFI